MLFPYTKTYCVNMVTYALADALRGKMVNTVKNLLDVYQAVTVIDSTCLTDWDSPAREAVSLIRDAIEACVDSTLRSQKEVVVQRVDKILHCRWFMNAQHEMAMKDV